MAASSIVLGCHRIIVHSLLPIWASVAGPRCLSSFVTEVCLLHFNADFTQVGQRFLSACSLAAIRIKLYTHHGTDSPKLGFTCEEQAGG